MLASSETLFGDRIADVAIVGAGPVGLTAALACRSLGLAPVVLEADAQDRIRPGSRAIFLHREPLGELDAVEPGIAARLIAAGMLWAGRRYYFRGKEFYSRSFAPESGKSHGTSLSQVDTERILMSAVRAHGIDVAWQAAVSGVRVVDDAVEIAVDGGRTLRARYVIAGDGARSVVRKALGIQMRGEILDSRWVIVDVGEVERDPLPPELIFHYEHPALDGLNVLLVPFKGGWRIDVQTRTQAALERMGSPDGVREWLPKLIDRRYAENIRWISTYRFNKLTAERFTDEARRILLAGEAAHLFPPFGGRGLNSGIVDAISAARAIARAHSVPDAAAARAAIDEVAIDRRDAARFNMEAAAIGVGIMAPNSPWRKIKRGVAVAALPWSKRARYWLSLGPNGIVGGRPGKAGIY
jgi:3-(3-hydroxy-phenyl)propionate hydroxylase